jgi:hypothetical protein
MAKKLTQTAADRFSGLMGNWKQITSLGIIGFVSFLLAFKLVVDDPAARALLLKTIGEERTISRDDTDKSRKHGNEAAKILSGAIEGLLTEAKDHNIKVRKNQEDLIRIQAELLKMSK